MKFETDVMKFDTILTSVNIFLTTSFCSKKIASEIMMVSNSNMKEHKKILKKNRKY